MYSDTDPYEYYVHRAESFIYSMGLQTFMAEDDTGYCGPVYGTHAQITVCGRPNYLNYWVNFIAYT